MECICTPKNFPRLHCPLHGIDGSELPPTPEQQARAWKERFVKYALIVGEAEGVSFLDERDWTPEEWAEISAAVEEGWK